MADPNMFTTPFQLTKTMHRDVYPAVDPSNAALAAKGKVVIITGAGGGLGAVSSPKSLINIEPQPKLTSRCKAIARAWAQAGAAGIVLVGRTTQTLNLTVDNISMINKSIPIIAEPIDVTNESSVKSLFAKVKAKFGKAHVLINNAATMASGMIGDIPIESWWGNYVRIFLNDVVNKYPGYASDQMHINRRPTSKAPFSRLNLSSRALAAKEPLSTSSALPLRYQGLAAPHTPPASSP